MSAPLGKLALLVVFLPACGSDSASPPNPETTGGTPATGGMPATGGVQAIGGVPTSGGVPATGGGGGRPSAGAGGAASSAALSFETDIWPVFSKARQPPFVYRGTGSYGSCTAAAPCHGSSPFGARLSMIDSDTAYRALIDVASNSSLCGGAVRVIPGDPDRSCLVLFYKGRLGEADLQWVDQAEVELMRQWIAQGARR